MAEQDSDKGTFVTLAEGRPVRDPAESTVLRSKTGYQRGGGLALLEDTQLIETLAHFPRERIPERVVHAKAAGAWGEFEVTHDVTEITSAKFLSEVGKKTKVLMRLSTVGGEKGSADTLRDIRGFAVKFFTEEGNYDIVGNDLPVFFIRDPIKFPSLNRSHKKHPQTAVPDSTMFWDFHNHNEEGVHCLMHLFGDRGVPKSLRNINGYGVHTFKYGRAGEDTFKYVKIHLKPDAGVETLSEEDAVRMAGEDPDHHVRDLYNSIEKGDFPSWTMNLQVMDPKEAENYRWNIFDPTKIWSHKDYPLIPVGRITLNRNPENYFAEVEQAAFSPSNLVPGIGPSADVMLQARMFSYPDAARYRVGPNYQQLPCNKALHVYAPFQRDGPMRVDGNYGGDPNYIRSRFTKVELGPLDVKHDEWVNSKVEAYTMPVTDDDYQQAKDLWELYKEQEVEQVFINNICGQMKTALPEVQAETIKMFGKVDKDIAERMQKKLKELDCKEPQHVKAPDGPGRMGSHGHKYDIAQR
ncbi:catalase-domain-containing protein [Sporormia fimetaria CBS 119925]|uniref:Catalase-domain-containing protein n=1 Tax=Sporormia fimetaria CBS 119925 TaxID=1340428 RepID=A0A6A6VHQ5_9PLEO|nr:catalase-domain-containing protein [Sporormia fimetaria CBS 119925]